MEPLKNDHDNEIFRLVRTLGLPPTEAQDTLFENLTTAERRLTSFERQRNELDKEINGCFSIINTIKSLHSPWRRLPAELLAEVFSYCAPEERTQRPSRRNTPLTLTRVCSTWYRIATSLPQLWSSVVLTSDLPYLPERLAHGTEYFRACALRSRNTPLELHLSIHFIAYWPLHDLIQQYSHNIAAISLHYPQSANVPADNQLPEGPCTWFVHGDTLILPNLRSLEIQDPNHVDSLSETDFDQLRTIANSAQCLQRYVFHNRLIQPNGPILTNWDNLTELTLIDPTPVALLSYILRNAPMLQFASFNCLYESLAPSINPSMQTLLQNPELNSPLTHARLKTLLISYSDAITLTSLFNLITLPSLEHVLFEKWTEDSSAWAQEAFISFLRRSECALRALDLYFTPVTSENLVEILKLPMVRGSLRELMIQSGHSEAEKIIDDDFCQFLTLPATPVINGEAEAEPSDADKIICPNLEVLGIYGCHSCSKPTLVRMLESRLDPQFCIHRPPMSSPSANTPTPRIYLKYFECDVPLDVAQQYFKPLLHHGLVTLLYDSNAKILPPTNEERKLLKRFTEEGLQLWEYDPIQGTWGPSDFWMKI